MRALGDGSGGTRLFEGVYSSARLGVRIIHEVHDRWVLRPRREKSRKRFPCQLGSEFTSMESVRAQ